MAQALMSTGVKIDLANALSESSHASSFHYSDSSV